MAGVLTAVRGLGGDLLDFFFPPACAVCRAAPQPDLPLCARCEQALTILPDPVCARCRSFIPEPHLRCPAGHLRQPQPVWALGLFDDYYRELIHAFKFHGRMNCGRFLGVRLAEMVAGDPRHRAVDCIVPVPLHRSRQRERGFNQSELLARSLADRLEIGAGGGALRRIRQTQTQTALDYRQRRENVAGAFAPGKEAVAGKTVLLVDDVMTTGATLGECASVLRQAGADRIFAAVAALAMVDI